MFVRFREKGDRLQLSLIETRRNDGKVQHEHIASLGAVPTPPSVADRIAFWQHLHERLGKLANRVNAEAQGKVLGAIHAKVPMVTADEQRALQLENAKADAQFWDNMTGLHASTVEDHKGLVAVAERKIASREAERATAAEHAAKARDRVARIERGEDVQGGLGEPPLTYQRMRRILRDTGMTNSDIDHAELLHEVAKAMGDDEVISTMVDAALKASGRAEKAALRRLARRLALG
jgi:hypothetical protein